MTARLQHFPVPFLTGAPNVFTMTGTLTLDDSSAQVQVLDPNSSNRTVTIPAPISGLAGLWYLVKHAGTANTIAVSDGGTLATLTASDYVLVVCNGTTWTAFTVQAGSDGFSADVISESTSATGVTIDGLLIKDGTIGQTLDMAQSVVAADQLINADLSVNHASAEGRAIDATAVQLTTARASGIMAAVAGTTTSLVGDAGGTYAAFYAAAPTDGGGVVTHVALKVGASHDVALDLSACATGEGDVLVADNLAVALEVREAANSYLVVKTTNNVEGVILGKPLRQGAQIIDMNDVAHALVQAAAGAGETLLTGNVLFVDPNSGGATEDLTLPPVATCAGMELGIYNTGGEGIVVKAVGGATIITLDTAQHGRVACNGTVWFGFIGNVT